MSARVSRPDDAVTVRVFGSIQHTVGARDRLFNVFSVAVRRKAAGDRDTQLLVERNRVVPWGDLAALVVPFAPDGRRGRPPFAVETMLRLHFMQQWFGLGDPAMEEALHDVPPYREFAGLDNWTTRLPDESTILRFRHLLEKHKLAAQILTSINDMLRDKGLMLRRVQPRTPAASETPRCTRPRKATSGTSA